MSLNNDTKQFSKQPLERQLNINVISFLLFQTPLPEQEGPTEGIEIDLELLSTKELAYYITTFDWDLFWAVHEYELLYHTFGRHHFGKVSLKYSFTKKWTPSLI